jgi:hypothetical protein
MPSEDDKDRDEGSEWASEREETTPEFMEPVVEVDDDGSDEVDITKARSERDAKGSALYRERRVVKEVVEEEETKPPKKTRAQLREEREVRKLARALERDLERRETWWRGTLAYKTFYDMVCNRIGVIIAGFGIAMILFTIAYDWLQGRQLSLGRDHMVALSISLVVYFFGMALEGLRAWSWECDGLEAAARAQAEEGPVATERTREETNHVPMIPEDALEKLNGNDEE